MIGAPTTLEPTRIIRVLTITSNNNFMTFITFRVLNVRRVDEDIVINVVLAQCPFWVNSSLVLNKNRKEEREKRRRVKRKKWKGDRAYRKAERKEEGKKKEQ